MRKLQKKMRKTASVLLCLVWCAVLLCACAGDAPAFAPADDSGADAGGNSGAAQDVVELTFWTFPVGNWGSPTAVSNLLTAFYREYPNIRITVEYLSYENGDAQIAAAVAEGTAPDLVLEGPERLVADWGEKGWLADLSDLWQSAQAEGIYENVRAACRNGAGAYYEFPICMSAHCMAINYDLFREAGALQYLDEEHHTWTTEGFIQAVHALEACGQESAGIVYCNGQSGDQGTRALVTNLYGGTFTDAAHTVYTVDSAENIRALQLLYDLESIAFEPEFTAADAIGRFMQKETAMCFCWNASMEIQQTINSTDLDFEIFPMAFPTSEAAPQLEGGIWGLGVFDNGNEERIEAAKTFIRCLTESDAMYTRAVQTSSYWPVRDLDGIYENDRLMMEYSIFMPYMGDYDQITPGWADARTAWWKLLARVDEGEDIAQAVRGFPAEDA